MLTILGDDYSSKLANGDLMSASVRFQLEFRSYPRKEASKVIQILNTFSPTPHTLPSIFPVLQTLPRSLSTSDDVTCPQRVKAISKALLDFTSDLLPTKAT